VEISTKQNNNCSESQCYLKSQRYSCLREDFLKSQCYSCLREEFLKRQRIVCFFLLGANFSKVSATGFFARLTILKSQRHVTGVFHEKTSFYARIFGWVKNSQKSALCDCEHFAIASITSLYVIASTSSSERKNSQIYVIASISLL